MAAMLICIEQNNKMDVFTTVHLLIAGDASGSTASQTIMAAPVFPYL